jgi:hypothetical protein
LNSNPYAPPTANVDLSSTTSSVEKKIRREHIRHEIQLKSVGTLYGLGALLILLSGFAVLIPLFFEDTPSDVPLGFLIGISLFYIALGSAMAAMAYGYRKLRPWVKIPGTILSGLGLLGIPLGTLINGYILYLIWCAKGQMVLENKYQRIIEATPHVKFQRTLGDKIALGIVTALLIGGALLLINGLIRN